jgi:hypothetical protein
MSADCPLLPSSHSYLFPNLVSDGIEDAWVALRLEPITIGVGVRPSFVLALEVWLCHALCDFM